MMKQLKMAKTVNNKDEKCDWVPGEPTLVFEYFGMSLPKYSPIK